MSTPKDAHRGAERDTAAAIPLGIGGGVAAVGAHIAHFFRGDWRLLALRQLDRTVFESDVIMDAPGPTRLASCAMSWCPTRFTSLRRRCGQN